MSNRLNKNHEMIVGDPVRIAGASQANFAVSSSVADSGPIAEAHYDVWCDETDVYIQVAATIAGLTTSTGYVIKQGNVVTVEVGEKERIGVITASATGTFRYHKVK